MSNTETAPHTPRSETAMPRGHAISWITLVITTLAILMTSIDHSILPAVLPAIKEEFGLNDAQAGLINSVFFFGLIGGAIFFGWLADRLGTGYMRTWTWIIAMGIGIIGGALTYGFSGAFASFMLLRIPMGISRGGSETVNVALVGEWWPKEHRGFAVGVHHTGFPIGQFLTGALISAVLVAGGGWREVFLLIPMLGIPILIAQAIVGTKKNQQKVYDWIDREHLTRPLPELTTRSSNSLIEPIKLALRSPNTRWAMLLVFLFLWAEAGAVTFLTTQLTANGVSLQRAVLVAGASGITGWIGQVAWGWWSDHKGRKFAIRFLIAGWTLTMLGFLLIHGETSAWLVLLAWGLFRNAPFPVLYAMLIDSVPKAAGTAMGLMIGIALGVSGVLAAPVQGFILDHWGYPAHYIAMAVIVALGFFPLKMMRETVDLDHPHHGANVAAN